MSFNTMAWAVNQTPETSTQKFILLMLANVADETGYCFPSTTYLMQACMMSRRTVQRNMLCLEEQGFIAREGRRRQDGTQATNGIFLSSVEQGVTNDTRSETTGRHPRQDRASSTTGQGVTMTPHYTVTNTITNTVTTARAWLETVLSEEMTKAILEHRRALKAPLSAFAAKLLAKELGKARDPNHAAAYMIERSWRGFKADWYNNANHGDQNNGPNLNNRDDALAVLRGECHSP